MKKKGIIIGIIIAAAAAAFCLWFFMFRGDSGSANERVVYVTKVGSLTGTDSGAQNKFNGVVETQSEIKINKDDNKAIAEIFVEVGQHVDAGTVLFSYDIEDIKLNFAQAELDVATASANITSLNQQLAELQQQKRYASQSEQFEYTVRIQQVQNDIRKAEYDKKSKELSVQKIKESMDNIEVKSPGAGVVQSINRETNNNAGGEQPSGAFITIVSTGDFRIKGIINEQNMAQIYEGMSMIIHSRVDDTVWTGKISEINRKPEQNSNNNFGNENSGEGSSQYPFYVNLDSSAGLMLGQHVYMKAGDASTVREGLWLYEGYFFKDDEGNSFVWAGNGSGKLEKRAVTLGEYDENSGEYKVEAGLDLTDVIAWPDDTIEEGTRCTENADEVRDVPSATEDTHGEEETPSMTDISDEEEETPSVTEVEK